RRPVPGGRRTDGHRLTRAGEHAGGYDERPGSRPWGGIPAVGADRCRSALALDDLLGRCGEDAVQVTDHAEVDELEDRGLLVLVDRDDGLGGLHARPVLNRTGDAGGDVELGRDHLAGLADLEGVRL